MDADAQIAALVSRTTRDLLERHVKATGVKQGHLIEQELPADVVVHPRLVVSASGSVVKKQPTSARPTSALRDLMRDGG